MIYDAVAMHQMCQRRFQIHQQTNSIQIHQTNPPASRIPARSGVGQTGQTIPATGQNWSKLVKLVKIGQM